MEPLFIESARYVVTPAGDSVAVYSDVDIVVENGKYTCIGKCVPPRGAIRISGRDYVVIPGLVNAHTHAAMSFLKGSFPDKEFWEWLPSVVDVEKKAITPELVYRAATLACIEMLMHGVIGFIDMYYHPLETVRACSRLGLYVKTGALPDVFEEFAAEASRYRRFIPTIILHSLYGEDEDTLEKGFSLGRSRGVDVHIHVSETRREVYLFRKDKGMWPIEYMDKKGWLGENVILVHLNWVLSNEIEIIARRGSSVVVCPSSSMRLAEAGFPPVYEMLIRGIRVGVGTDGSSGDRFDVLGEIREALLLYRHNYWDTRLRHDYLLSRLITNGYSILGIGGGVIKENAPAHLAMLRIKPYRHRPLTQQTAPSILVLTGGWEADYVVIDGEVALSPEKKPELVREAVDAADYIEEYIRGKKLELI